MKKILLLLPLVTFTLFAFTFTPKYTKILQIQNLEIKVNKPIQKGITGFVLDKNMIIAKAVSLGKGYAKLLPFNKLKNSALATPKTFPKVGDKVVFGLYNLVGLIIAPNVDTYNKIKAEYPYITWINSDIFATMFTNKPTKADFRNFCQTYNAGIIDFALDKEYIVDCSSFQVLKTTKLPTKLSTKWKNPFFASYTKWVTSLFSSKPNNWLQYYKSLIK